MPLQVNQLKIVFAQLIVLKSRLVLTSFIIWKTKLKLLLSGKTPKSIKSLPEVP